MQDNFTFIKSKWLRFNNLSDFSKINLINILMSIKALFFDLWIHSFLRICKNPAILKLNEQTALSIVRDSYTPLDLGGFKEVH